MLTIAGHTRATQLFTLFLIQVIILTRACGLRCLDAFDNTATFPNGMQAVVDAIHAIGFKFGLYTDRGLLTCASRPGSWGFEHVDAATYAAWGVDFLKVRCMRSQSKSL